MFGTLFKALIVALIVCAVTAGLGLIIMAGVAGTHDVKPIAIPRDTSLATIAQQWDYADAYRRPMEFTAYRNIQQVIDNVPVRGDGEIHRSAKEVVYTGSLPGGLSYQVAYMLDRESFPPAIKMVTVYRFTSKHGRFAWKVWRPVHRCLAPYLLDRLGSRAPG
jgi:hypothetical protein